MRTSRIARLGGPGRACLVAAALLGSGCGTMSSPKATRTVRVMARTSHAAVHAASGTVEITSLRLVVGQASLGNGQQFGCADCQNNNTVNETGGAQQVLDVPVGGGAVLVATEQVRSGHYTAAELGVENPAAATLSHAASWPAGATIDIAGRINGKSFDLPLTVTGSLIAGLATPIDVPASGATPSPISATVDLPAASWFMSSNSTLDPADPAQRAQIEANVRASFQPAETDGAGTGAARSKS